MPTFWSMPCKRNASGRYRHGWMAATGERWRVLKERRGPYRHVTKWFIAHSKKLRPNAAKKNDERRWRLMGYEGRNNRPSFRTPHAY